MLGRTIRYELRALIMKSLGELKLLIKEYAGQSVETAPHNVKIEIVLSGIKSESLATHLRLT